MLGSVYELCVASRFLIIAHSDSPFEVFDMSACRVLFFFSKSIQRKPQVIGWLCLYVCLQVFVRLLYEI